jgi:hypothetical protein
MMWENHVFLLQTFLKSSLIPVINPFLFPSLLPLSKSYTTDHYQNMAEDSTTRTNLLLMNLLVGRDSKLF